MSGQSVYTFVSLRRSLVAFLQSAVLAWFALLLPIQQVTSAARPNAPFVPGYAATVTVFSVVASVFFGWWFLQTNRRPGALVGFVFRAWAIYWLLAVLVSVVTLWFTGGEHFSDELSSAIRLALFVVAYGVAYWYVFQRRSEPANGSPI